MRPRDENKEQAIREKAIEMAVELGFDGLSMQKLAKAAGVSPATIYIYYKDREDLLAQLSIYVSTKMIAATFKDFDPSMSFEEGMKVQWFNRAKYWMDNPIEGKFVEQVKHSPYNCHVVPTMKKDFSEKMKAFVKNAIARGEMQKLPVAIFWSTAFAPLYSLIKFHMAGKSMSGERFVLTDDILMQALQLTLKALKP